MSCSTNLTDRKAAPNDAALAPAFDIFSGVVVVIPGPSAPAAIERILPLALRRMKMLCVKSPGQSLMARDVDQLRAEITVCIAVLQHFTGLGTLVTEATCKFVRGQGTLASTQLGKQRQSGEPGR